MVKRHLKRLNAPKSWDILRKQLKFIVRANPGPHNKKTSVALGVLIRDVLGYAKTSKEVKFMLIWVK